MPVISLAITHFRHNVSAPDALLSHQDFSRQILTLDGLTQRLYAIQLRAFTFDTDQSPHSWDLSGMGEERAFWLNNGQ